MARARPVKKGAFPAKTVKAPDAVWGLVMGVSGRRLLTRSRKTIKWKHKGCLRSRARGKVLFSRWKDSA
jgi:hypothetical protein